MINYYGGPLGTAGRRSPRVSCGGMGGGGEGMVKDD